jgi:hypothetical protein
LGNLQEELEQILAEAYHPGLVQTDVPNEETVNEEDQEV